jgi:hypothetical protein
MDKFIYISVVIIFIKQKIMRHLFTNFSLKFSIIIKNKHYFLGFTNILSRFLVLFKLRYLANQPNFSSNLVHLVDEHV